jgi:hypothetical protein
MISIGKYFHNISFFVLIMRLILTFALSFSNKYNRKRNICKMCRKFEYKEKDKSRRVYFSFFNYLFFLFIISPSIFLNRQNSFSILKIKTYVQS